MRGPTNLGSAFRALRLVQGQASQVRQVARAKQAATPTSILPWDPPPANDAALTNVPDGAHWNVLANPGEFHGRDSPTLADLDRSAASNGSARAGLPLESGLFSPYTWPPESTSYFPPMVAPPPAWRQLPTLRWSSLSTTHLSATSAGPHAPHVPGSSATGSSSLGPLFGGPGKGGGSSSRSSFSSSSEAPEVRQLVITACGPDRPGLVSALSKRILEKGGNVEQSRMARLAGEFSIIMLCSVDASVPRIAEDLKESLMRVQGLQITTRWAELEKPARKLPKEFRKISLRGADNPGLVYNVTEYLAASKINIENLETSTEEAPFGGTTLFTMEGVIAMPANMPTEALAKNLEVLQDSLGVLIELHNMDPQKKGEDMKRWREQSETIGGASRYSILAQAEGDLARGDRLI